MARLLLAKKPDDYMKNIFNKVFQRKDAGKFTPGAVSKTAPGAFFSEIGDTCIFIARFFRELFRGPAEPAEFLKQSFRIGYQSLGLVVTTGFIMGLVLTIQSRPTLADFGAESWLPAMVAVSIVREIGPVVTALICAGKAGSGIGAELASMRITEQIDAMEVSGTNPFKFIVVTRVLAAVIMIPLLVIFADAAALCGSFAGVNIS